MQTINFASQKIQIVPYGANSEMVRNLEGRCSPNIFRNHDRSGFSNLNKMLTDERVIRQDYFNRDPKEIEVRLVDPNDVGIIAGETFHQFSMRMKSEFDLDILPAGAFPALCTNFNPRLFKKETVLTSIFQLKIGKMYTHAVITMIVGQNNIPQLRLIQFDVERELKKDFNYLFMES